MLTGRRFAAAVIVVSLLAPLAACIPGDPDYSPVGFTLLNGRVAAVVPQCGDEKVVGMEAEADPYDENGKLREESQLFWKVSGLKQLDSTGPFVVGDPAAWERESDSLVATLPDSFLVSVETTRRRAVSSVRRAALDGLPGDQVLIDGNAGSLASLTKKWSC
ncbi:hypothetical protein [Micromonospora sp. NPDC093277]|uniref:hypothetical protein n=1 Tax=Micromonospora sp. NPDC093277 TaxID=3364291 RepID=UPI0037F4B788